MGGGRGRFGTSDREAATTLHDLDRDRSKWGLVVVMLCVNFWLIVFFVCLHFF
jgi:hypothetical protein